MSKSRSPSDDVVKARAQTISKITEVLAALAGTVMIALGLISVGQAAFFGKDFSTPQTV
ncbi:MAG: hypothetical protein ACON4T_00420 [Synechococcus sp.]